MWSVVFHHWTINFAGQKSPHILAYTSQLAINSRSKTAHTRTTANPQWWRWNCSRCRMARLRHTTITVTVVVNVTQEQTLQDLVLGWWWGVDPLMGLFKLTCTDLFGFYLFHSYLNSWHVPRGSRGPTMKGRQFHGEFRFKTSRGFVFSTQEEGQMWADNFKGGVILIQLVYYCWVGDCLLRSIIFNMSSRVLFYSVQQ